MKTLSALRPLLLLPLAIGLLPFSSQAQLSQLTFIPFGSTHYDGSYFWSNSAYPVMTVTNWEGWQLAWSNMVFLANGGGTNKGTSFSFNTNHAPIDSGTNFVVDLSGASFQEIRATNDLNFEEVTNGPGCVETIIFPNGANRLISLNTNWCMASTNGLGLTNGYYQVFLTNANSKAAVLRTVSRNNVQTNVHAWFWIGSP